MIEIFIVIFWIICGLIGCYIDYKEYQIVLKNGYYRLIPTGLIDYIVYVMLGSIGLIFAIISYYRTKRKYR